jgi:protein gp37
VSTKTTIEWTKNDDGSAGRTWNVVTGCDKTSPGCDHCYAENIARRFAGGPGFPNGFAVTVHPERLTAPLRWRKPTRVFVNSMSDMFHAGIPDELIAQMFAVMAATPQHTYQILTKRHGRMRSLLNSPTFEIQVFQASADLELRVPLAPSWPLRNVHVGVSVEDQKWADIRIPALIDTPAAVRFLSCEPLLGPIDLIGDVHAGHDWYTDFGQPVCLTCSTEDTTVAYFEREHRIHGIDWVIVGGESGPGARPMHPDWARSLRDQCNEAEVPFFFKQHGEWAPRSGLAPEELVNLWDEKRVTYVHPADGRTQSHGDWGMHDHLEGWAAVQRVGKHAAGRELDGRTWDEMPRVAEAVNAW